MAQDVGFHSQAMQRTIETSIDTLRIKLNKTLRDMRGVLVEVAPGGVADPFLHHSIGNIYVSITSQRGIARAAHCHRHLVETVSTVAGSALWIFKDMRPSSPTTGAIFELVLGGSLSSETAEPPSLTLPGGVAASVRIPPGVFHVFYSLSDAPLIVISIGSLPYDESDHQKIDPLTVEGVMPILERYGLAPRR